MYNEDLMDKTFEVLSLSRILAYKYQNNQAVISWVFQYIEYPHSREHEREKKRIPHIGIILKVILTAFKLF